MRTFEDKAAVRERVPLLLGLYGPSGGGKTYSALRLATGIERVVGGEIFVIDTESNRAKHYAPLPGEKPRAGQFKFRHVSFVAPFGPLDYLAAIQHCIDRGATTIIIDSMSHEHEGPGGVLEQHDVETERLAKSWRCSPAKTQMPAWAKPKAARRRLLNTMLQMSCNFVMCFRAKEKIKIVTGKDPVQLGWMPIAGDEFVYEMTLRALLPPSANGVAQWKVDKPGEVATTKLPVQFRELCSRPRQFDEAMGEEMARWAMGNPKANTTTDVTRFSEKLKWDGRPQLGGKPLSCAPLDVLQTYADVVRQALSNVPPRYKSRMSEHLDAVQSAIANQGKQTPPARSTDPGDESDPSEADAPPGYEVDELTGESIPMAGDNAE